MQSVRLVAAVAELGALDGGRPVILNSDWPSVENKNFAIQLGLLEMLHALSSLCVSRDEECFLKARDAPILIGNNTARVTLRFFSCVALNPAVVERAASGIAAAGFRAA